MRKRSPSYPLHDRTAALIERSAALCADLTAMCAVSRSLVDGGRARRLTSTYPLLRRITGGSDVAVVTETIRDMPLCLSCIARKSGVPVLQVDAVLRSVAGTARLTTTTRECADCRQKKTTFRLGPAAAVGAVQAGRLSVDKPVEKSPAGWITTRFQFAALCPADRAGLVTALIIGRPMCEDCIADRAAMIAIELGATLATIATILELHRGVDRCRMCGETKIVLSVDRPRAR